MNPKRNQNGYPMFARRLPETFSKYSFDFLLFLDTFCPPHGLPLASLLPPFGCLWLPFLALFGTLWHLVLLPGADFGPLDGPWAAPGLWRLLAAPGPLLGRPGALLAAPGRPLGPFWRLLSGSWSSLGGSKVALCRKARIRRPYSVFSRFFGPPGAHLAPPEALLGLSWRTLGPSWRLLGGLSGVGRLLGGSWQGPVGPRWFLGGSGLVPWWARGRRIREGPEPPYVFIV